LAGGEDVEELGRDSIGLLVDGGSAPIGGALGAPIDLTRPTQPRSSGVTICNTPSAVPAT
jgi:hypothetical protein